MDPSITPNAMSRRDFLQCTAVAASAVSLPLVPATLAAAPAAPGEAAQAFAEPLPVVLKVNGLTHKLSLEPRVTLLDALRESLGLTGTKKGCDHGQCGACTVHVGGRRVLSCLTLAASVREPVTTPAAPARARKARRLSFSSEVMGLEQSSLCVGTSIPPGCRQWTNELQ